LPILTPKDGGGQPSDFGKYSLAEIASQPQCWINCLKRLEKGGTLREIAKRFVSSPEWVFVGCGSSYYIALAAAASWTSITGTRARAVPASELLLFPDLAFSGMKEFVPVLISRSGQTSEVLRVAQLLSDKRIPSVAISCAPGQKLEKMATAAILLPDADEQSTVMTRSFTSMLLALQCLAATVAGNHGLLESFQSLPAVAERVLRDLPQRMRKFIDDSSFSDYVCLGQGPYYGLACESALKVTEMSCTYSQSFHTLEFRHGPKSIISGSVLTTFLLSGSNHDAEVEVLEEIKELGAKTLVVASHVSRRARASADFAVDLECDLPEISCLAPFVFAGQLAGAFTALRKGLDPDNPANLSRVVVLAD